MKNTIKFISVFAAAAVVLSGCIKEVMPQSSTATATQVGESASALAASVNGIPAQMSKGYLIYGTQESELDMGIPGLMITMSELTGEMYPVGDAGYDHYSYFNTCERCGKTTFQSYIPWRTLYIFVKAANDVIGAIDEATASDQDKVYLGMACAYRAFSYWMLMNFYEPVTNPYTDCSGVLGLTVPIVTEKTTEADAANNPRATKEAMVEFILSDLDKAEQCLQGQEIKDKLIPSYAVVCGLKARCYMSSGDYAKAKEFARKAITASGCKPLTQTQWEDANTGFNTANDAWMWKIAYSAEEMGNLCNFTGWMSGEADWGYGALTVPGIDAGLYDKIPDTDFRKHTWIDPDKTAYYNYQTCRDAEWFAAAPAYASLKFRPVGGDYETYSVGGACDVPLMRVEEMYYIEAEAAGLQRLNDGIELLEAFVKANRQPDYSCSAASIDAFEKEILFQKKIEFWGEGIAFFDAKRMKAGCNQSYVGTNAPGDEFKLNCEVIKPNWVFMIPESEESSNVAITKSTNNPDPSSAATPDLRY